MNWMDFNINPDSGLTICLICSSYHPCASLFHLRTEEGVHCREDAVTVKHNEMMYVRGQVLTQDLAWSCKWLLLFCYPVFGFAIKASL